MSQFSASASGSSRSNVYTVLLLAAFLSLVGACVFVAMKTTEMTGEANPFTVKQVSEIN